MSIKVQILPTILFLLLGMHENPLKVNSLLDGTDSNENTVTLRSAFDTAKNGDTITFDESLDGKTIKLTVVGEEHSILKGEVMGMREEPSGLISYLVGYFERDYGHSALYARKNIIIDASILPNGITIEWAGQGDNHARVMAVFGDLTLKNVKISGGKSISLNISASNADQPWSLARGGGLAVWGKLRLEKSEVFHNQCISDDPEESRDRGAFGGGIYANIVEIHNSIIGGNSVKGAGAAGGGIYSVGGADTSLDTSRIEQSVITGNRISGLFTYGGGLFSDGGGIGNRKYMEIINSTIFGNMVEPAAYPPFLLSKGYWRGGGIYMSNGYLKIRSSTIVENEVYGYHRTDSLDKSNLAGGIAATIGNAHAVEEMEIGHSIIAGNTITKLDLSGETVTFLQDVFTGSLLHFKSLGYNRIGAIDFNQILVPVGKAAWKSLSRKHYPQTGDADNVNLEDVVDMIHGKSTSSHILSAGVAPTTPAVLYYSPAASAIDRIPQSYSISEYYFEYTVSASADDTFLQIFLNRIESNYGLDQFALNFEADFNTFLETVDIDDVTEGLQPYTDPEGNPILSLADTKWFGPDETWPSNIANYSYIHFWHRLDKDLESKTISGMGPELLNDSAWSSLFTEGPLLENRDISMIVFTEMVSVAMQQKDQLGHDRPLGNFADIGSIESD